MAPFSALLLKHMKKLKMGHGTDETVTLGPVQTLRGREKGEQHIQDAVAKGATLLRPEGTSLPAQGFFVEPSLLLDCKKSMLVYEEESFAPLLALSAFDTEEEVSSPFQLLCGPTHIHSASRSLPWPTTQKWG